MYIFMYSFLFSDLFVRHQILQVAVNIIRCILVYMVVLCCDLKGNYIKELFKLECII
jgi:hypothetical protein